MTLIKLGTVKLIYDYAYFKSLDCVDDNKGKLWPAAAQLYGVCFKWWPFGDTGGTTGLTDLPGTRNDFSFSPNHFAPTGTTFDRIRNYRLIKNTWYKLTDTGTETTWHLDFEVACDAIYIPQQ